ncbi:hypothetical protein H2203_002771 [Taxawa tesnikishii (nom. ined.)]|nr:hypothetical protein H2203_002771 [Dothideales sp. JES 119]
MGISQRGNGMIPNSIWQCLAIVLPLPARPPPPQQNPHFNSLVRLIESENLLSRPLETLRVQPVAGYTSQAAEISGPTTSDDREVMAPAAGDRVTEGVMAPAAAHAAADRTISGGATGRP